MGKLSALPPDPKIRFDSETFALINEADKLLYQLEGAINALPENHFVLPMLTLLEAYYSYLVDDRKHSGRDISDLFLPAGVSELNLQSDYVSSISLAQKLLRDVSSSSHIIKSIHKRITGGENSSGIFREERLVVRHYSEDSSRAGYEAPSPEDIPTLMKDLESYISSNVSYPVVVNAALVHGQFEMIHPFSGGNGLVGRILVQIHLIWKKRLVAPALLISEQFYKRRAEYFDRLEDLEKNGTWEAWVKYFLHIIIDSAVRTNTLIKKSSSLERKDYNKILQKEMVSSASLKLFDLLLRNPVVSLSSVTKELVLNKQTANVLLSKFLEEKILEEITGQKRNRLFAYKEYLDILKSS